jgi:Glycine/sarcosine/betaine reductase selenoprotein B (GRDB)
MSAGGWRLRQSTRPCDDFVQALANPASEDTMDQTLDTLLGFAPDYDQPIPYMRRTREYYAAIGYTTPYRWAHYLVAPFTPLSKPLKQSKVAIITTAAPFQPGKGDQGPGAPYNGSAKFYTVYSGDTAHDHDLRISHIGYDRMHTTATDSGTWFPLPALRRAVTAGRIGAVAGRFHGAPTNRSHRVTVETDAPEILARVRDDGADVAIVVPNCPVCHQTSSLVARHLEANGIPTVLMGCAKDIVEHAAAPRFLFSDFPLGNSAGKPHDLPSQDRTLELALHLLETAAGPQTTMQSPLRWNDDGKWKLDYLNLEQIGEEELKRRREEFDRQKELARPNRSVKAA